MCSDKLYKRYRLLQLDTISWVKFWNKRAICEALGIITREQSDWPRRRQLCALLWEVCIWQRTKWKAPYASFRLAHHWILPRAQSNISWLKLCGRAVGLQRPSRN